ncbi:MAG: hypothetical protein ACE5GV_10290 [Candidatus Scalindua sp.]
MWLFDSIEYLIWNFVFSFFFLIVLLLTLLPVYILLVLGIIALLDLFKFEYLDSIVPIATFIGIVSILILDGLLTRSATKKKVFEDLKFKHCAIFSITEFLFSLSMIPIFKLFRKKYSR